MATVLVTGGRGWLGQLLVDEVLRRGQLEYGQPQTEQGPTGHTTAKTVEKLVVVDMIPEEEKHRKKIVENIVGDIKDAAFLQSLFSQYAFDSVFHLAAVLSGQAELDFDLGMKVNVDATRALLDLCRQAGNCPKFIMTSSVAVFGHPSVSGSPLSPETPFSEDTPVLPRSSYGTEKAICELLLLDSTRRGFTDARAVRLPTVVVRPGRPNAATSSFCSSIIREPLKGEPAVCPVAKDLPIWVQSPKTVIQNIAHAHDVVLGSAAPIITLPGLTTTPEQMMQALAACGGDPSLVSWEPNEFLNRVVSSWPGFIHTPTGLSLGFKRDANFASIIRDYMESVSTQA